MKTHPFQFAAALFLLTLAASLQPVHAQTSYTYTLAVDGIQGDSTSAAGFPVTGWSFGVEVTGSGVGGGGGGGAGRANFEEVVVSKPVDSASPLLMKACATGQHIPTVVLKGTRKGPKAQEYLIIKMSDVVISSVSLGGTSGKTAPAENVSFSCTEIEYIIRKKTGEEVKFPWNLVTNKSP